MNAAVSSSAGFSAGIGDNGILAAWTNVSVVSPVLTETDSPTFPNLLQVLFGDPFATEAGEISPASVEFPEETRSRATSIRPASNHPASKAISTDRQGGRFHSFLRTLGPEQIADSVIQEMLQSSATVEMSGPSAAEVTPGNAATSLLPEPTVGHGTARRAAQRRDEDTLQGESDPAEFTSTQQAAAQQVAPTLSAQVSQLAALPGSDSAIRRTKPEPRPMASAQSSSSKMPGDVSAAGTAADSTQAGRLTTSSSNDAASFGLASRPKASFSERLSFGAVIAPHREMPRSGEQPAGGREEGTTLARRSLSSSLHPWNKPDSDRGQAGEDSYRYAAPARWHADGPGAGTSALSAVASAPAVASREQGLPPAQTASVGDGTQLRDAEVPALHRMPISESATKQGITLKVGQTEGRSVDIHLRQRQGDILVAVRAGDSTLEHSLRTHLPDLVQALDQAGYNARTFANPADYALATVRGTQAVLEPQQSSFGGAHSQGSNDGGQANSNSSAGHQHGHPGARQNPQRMYLHWAEQMEA